MQNGGCKVELRTNWKLNVVKRQKSVTNVLYLQSKTTHVLRKNVKQMVKAKLRKINEQRKRTQELFRTRVDHALNIDFRVNFVKPFIFTSI